MVGTDGERLIPPQFIAKIQVSESGCWEWTASLSPAGYGQAHLVMDGRRQWLAHRLIYRLCVEGDDPPGMHLHHTCGVRRCVRPCHLVPIDGGRHMQHHHPLRQFCTRGHEWTDANTYWRKTPSGGRARMCRACRNEDQRIRYREYSEERKAAQHARSAQQRRERKAAGLVPTPSGLPEGDTRHGTSNGYTNHGCRCDDCRTAASAYAKRLRSRR